MGGSVLIILLNGSINSGKTTVSKQIVQILPRTAPAEIAGALATLKPLMRELASCTLFDKDNPSRYSRSWFAANPCSAKFRRADPRALPAISSYVSAWRRDATFRRTVFCSSCVLFPYHPQEDPNDLCAGTFPPLLRAAVSTILLSLYAASPMLQPVKVDPAALALLQKVQTATRGRESLRRIS